MNERTPKDKNLRALWERNPDNSAEDLAQGRYKVSIWLRLKPPQCFWNEETKHCPVLGCEDCAGPCEAP